MVKKFRAGLEEKKELVLNLSSLEQKLSLTANPDYYWKKTHPSRVHGRKLEPGDASVRRGTLCMPMRRGSNRVTIMRTESGNLDKRVGAGRRQSVQISFTKMCESSPSKYNYNSSGSKYSVQSRSPSRKTSTTNVNTTDSTPAQMKCLIESGEGTRSNSVQSSNGQEKPMQRIRGEKKKSYFAHEP